MFKTKNPNPMFENVSDVMPQELNELMQSGAKIKLVDVRQPEEFTGELGHIDGAELLVLDQLSEKFQKLNPAEDIVLICKSGGRSAKAASFLSDQGFKKVFNMKGGMLAWNDLGFPTTHS